MLISGLLLRIMAQQGAMSSRRSSAGHKGAPCRLSMTYWFLEVAGVYDAGWSPEPMASPPVGGFWTVSPSRAGNGCRSHKAIVGRACTMVARRYFLLDDAGCCVSRRAPSRRLDKPVGRATMVGHLPRVEPCIISRLATEGHRIWSRRQNRQARPWSSHYSGLPSDFTMPAWIVTMHGAGISFLRCARISEARLSMLAMMHGISVGRFGFHDDDCSVTKR